MGRSVVEHLLKMYAGGPGPISDISSYKELVANYVKGLRQLECQNQSEWTKSRNMGEGVWVQFMKGKKWFLIHFSVQNILPEAFPFDKGLYKSFILETQ